jgi:sec-independent protein translocase protein TatB
MFDIGWTELLVVGIVALIVIGPRELPKTLRTVGQMMTKVRRMASEFQGQFNEAIREAELDELRKEAEKLSSVATSAGSFDALATAKSEIESAFEAPVKSETAAAPAPETASLPAPATTDTVPEPEAAPEPAAESAPGESSTDAPASGGGRSA